MRADERRQVVVVGSGFGGAVTACRLAQAGCDVLVLERGRRFEGDFPRKQNDPWRWEQKGQGPFDVRWARGVLAVVAAGVGGGSLLYSNVHLRMPEDGFATWPAGWDRRSLDPYYDLVAGMLDLRRPCEPEAQRYWELPPRAGLLRDAAHEVDRGADVSHPPLAVDFGDPRRRRTNRFGAEQSGCRHCGKCSVGCNFGAKNSLDKNYLPWAVNRGAELRARCEVIDLGRELGGGYWVRYRDHGARTEGVVVTDTLVLAAGAIGTTELLLEHRDQLGELSDQLGQRYSANGDYVTTAVGVGRKWKPALGPAITTSVRRDDGATWFLVQDGGFPALGVLAPWTGVLPDTESPPCPPGRREIVISAEHVAPLLAMGRDSADGWMRLRRFFSGVAIDWPWRANAAFHEAESDYLHCIGQKLGEKVNVDPSRFLHVPVSVHNLGGAVMADDPDHGVVKPTGEVFNADGLYVMDGAAIPSATGTNPSHTIAAVAERNAERLARQLTGRSWWKAPTRPGARLYRDQLPVS